MSLTDEEWASLSTAHNAWVDDLGDVLEGLADAVEVAERSLEGEALARAVVTDLRRRLDAALLEIVERTNEMTLRVSALQRD